jgi:hypothetical protein
MASRFPTLSKVVGRIRTASAADAPTAGELAGLKSGATGSASCSESYCGAALSDGHINSDLALGQRRANRFHQPPAT